MPPSEIERLALYETLIDRLGDKAAATLMEHLPPGGWENVTTKDDLRLVKDDLRLVRDEVRLVEERLTGKINALDTKINGLDTKIDSGLTALRGEFDTKIDGLGTKIDGLDTKIDSGLTALRGEFDLAMARQTRTIVFTMVGIAITIWLALLLPIGAG